MCDINIIKIIEPMKQGYTKPYLCEASDGKKYVVKGLKATYGGLVKEWISAHLGVQFGLNIPRFHLAFLDNHLDLEQELVDLENEICFASEYINGAKEIQVSMINQFDPEEFRKLFFFDYWIKNDDRNLSEYGGNANLFVTPNEKQPFVLDHNLAFDKSFNLENHKKHHLAAHIWRDHPDLICLDEYKYLIELCLKNIDTTINTLPTEWLERYPHQKIQEDIVKLLLNYQTDEFWEAIK